MATADALMGMGVNPLLAARTANAGTGPLTIVPAGSSFATAKALGNSQYLVSANGADSSCLALPTIGGDNGALLGDDFVISNQGSSSIFIFSSSGVGISVGTANTSKTTIQAHTSMALYAVATTQWIGIKGA